MTAVFDNNILRSGVLALALTAGLGIAASSIAQADSGFTPPSASDARAAAPGISTGWHDRYCRYVWSYPKNGKTFVEIYNDDGSSIWYSGDTEAPSVTQEMMMRACYRQGARYSFRVYNNNGKWDALRAY